MPLSRPSLSVTDSPWPIRVHRIDTDKAEGGEEGAGDFSLPVFAVVLTKFKDLPNMKQVTGISLFVV